MDAFTEFEHEGWERVADKYDSVWSSSTRQFIAPLLDAAEVREGMAVLDVGCGAQTVRFAGANCIPLLASLISAYMNPSKIPNRPEAAAISSEALVGLGITIGALGLLGLLLGLAQHMRSVPGGAMLLFGLGAGLVVLGIIIAAAAGAGKRR